MTEHRLVDYEDSPDDIEYGDIKPHQRWTLALDKDGDLMFSEEIQSFRTVDAEKAVKQSLNVALGTVQGEDPLDEDFGLNIFKATGSFTQLEREIRRTLIYDDYQHNRVDHVDRVNITQLGKERRAHVEVEVTLQTGEIDVLEIDLGMAL